MVTLKKNSRISQNFNIFPKKPLYISHLFFLSPWCKHLSKKPFVISHIAFGVTYINHKTICTLTPHRQHTCHMVVYKCNKNQVPYCRNPTLAKCGGEAQHLEKVGIGVVATLAFGWRLRQGGWEVAGLEVDPRVTSHAPGSAKSVREWTLTLPSELPCWELVRVGVPKGLPKLQRAFWRVKTPWLVALLISMESSWSVDV
jgi:hypothetical protein